jgi:hypothetical protein
MKLVYENTGCEVKTGDVAHTFRGEAVYIEGWREPQHSGSTGRVYVKFFGDAGWSQEFFPSVIGAVWVQ